MKNINHTFTVANIQNISSKRGKVGKNKKFDGYHIKIKAECNSEFLQLLAYDDPPNYDLFYFDDDGTPKASYISVFVVSRLITDHKLLIDLEVVSEQSKRFLNITIPSFKVSPIVGFEYSIAFSIFIETDDEDLIFLNKAAKMDNILMSIESMPEITAF